MYIIGLGLHSFLRIKTNTCYSNKGIELVVTTVFYDVEYKKATVFSDYNQAERILQQIKNRKNEISFSNDNVVDQLLDEKNGYKLEVAQLEVFQLAPVRCKKVK